MPSTPVPTRPSLAALAATPRTTTIRKLWKALTSEERAQGIAAALADDENGWVKTATRTAVAGALRFRPQTVATWPRPKLVAEAARLPLEDVQLLSAYLIDLHLGHRRPMMAAFLDQLAIPNEDGRIDSETTEVGPQNAGKVMFFQRMSESYRRDPCRFSTLRHHLSNTSAGRRGTGVALNRKTQRCRNSRERHP